MTNGNGSTEWLDVMLGELEQRRRERREAEEEAARREDSPTAGGSKETGEAPGDEPHGNKRKKARNQSRR